MRLSNLLTLYDNFSIFSFLFYKIILRQVSISSRFRETVSSCRAALELATCETPRLGKLANVDQTSGTDLPYVGQRKVAGMKPMEQVFALLPANEPRLHAIACTAPCVCVFNVCVGQRFFTKFCIHDHGTRRFFFFLRSVSSFRIGFP